MSDWVNCSQDGGSAVLTGPPIWINGGPTTIFAGTSPLYGGKELCSKLAIAGFEDIVIYSYGVPIYNLMKPFMTVL